MKRTSENLPENSNKILDNVWVKFGISFIKIFKKFNVKVVKT